MKTFLKAQVKGPLRLPKRGGSQPEYLGETPQQPVRKWVSCVRGDNPPPPASHTGDRFARSGRAGSKLEQAYRIPAIQSTSESTVQDERVGAEVWPGAANVSVCVYVGVADPIPAMKLLSENTGNQSIPAIQSTLG